MSGPAIAVPPLCLLGEGLGLEAGKYEVLGPNRIRYLGDRPVVRSRRTGREKVVHAHGFFGRRVVTIHAGRLVCTDLEKRRWRVQPRGRTCHSRPPNEIPHLQSCALIVLLVVYAGLVRGRQKWAMELPEEMALAADARTVARWTERATKNALYTEHCVRSVVLEMSEPEPADVVFGSGLAPPERLLRRPWQDLSGITRLWRGIRMLLVGHSRLGVDCARLLAQARHRATALKRQIPF